ncbi:MAG: methyltransferase domain-containing protein [Dehalococcoidia bacterium]|nr:methyltransferase domain-containing protein [Dehalococcoidia bacterium]
MILAAGRASYWRSWLVEVGEEGHVAGIDISDAMLARASVRVEQEGLSSRVGLLRSDVGQLPMPDGSLDFAVAVQVYLYATDVLAALGEVRRALKPGGRLVVVDTDWESCVWLTNDDARNRRMRDARVAEFQQPNLAPVAGSAGASWIPTGGGRGYTDPRDRP